MAISTVNIGSAPNDGTGDPLRTAFNKLNTNFLNITADGGDEITVTDPTTSTDQALNDALANIYASGGGGSVTSVNGDTGVVVVDLQSATDEGNTITDGTDTMYVNPNGIEIQGVVNQMQILNDQLIFSDGTNDSSYSLEVINNNGVSYPLPTGASSQIATLADITGGVSDGDKGDITVGSSGTVWTIDNGAVNNAKVASGIDAVKIGSGNVSNTEFDYLDGVTSAIQTQLDNRVGYHFKNTTQTVVTGTTGEVIIYAEEVLANSISDNTILSFKSRISRNPRVGTCTLKLYVNTVNNLSGSPVQIAQVFGNAGTGLIPLIRDTFLIKSNTLSGYPFTTNSVNDLSSTGVTSSTTYNINTTYYWILTAQQSDSSDVATHQFSILERI